MPTKAKSVQSTRSAATARAASAKARRPAAVPTRRKAAKRDSRLVVLSALRDELKRSMEHLKLGNHRRPHFIAYLLRSRVDFNLSAKVGAIVEDDEVAMSYPHVDARVGTYKDDNTDPSEGVYDGFDPEGWAFGPIEADPHSIRRMFWLLTDRQYKRATQEFLEKRGRGATRVRLNRKAEDFTREKPVRHVGPRREADFEIDRDRWRDILRETSVLLGEEEWIEDSLVSLHATHVRQYFVNSEGSEHIQERVGFSLNMHAATTAPKDGSPLDFGVTLNVGRREELPAPKQLAEHAREIVQELAALRNAPALSPYSGPALLGPDVTGVIFHEAVGHRLEGERMRLMDEGHTFKGKIGKRIVPDFIDLLDDPTLEEYDGTAITGHYLYDEQGVAARPVELVKKGVLKEYLLSRTPAPGFRQSNGHGRSDGRSRPQARMGVFIIRGRNEKTRDELKAILLDECRRQRKAFGLIIEKIDNGMTTTTTHEFQAFAEYPMRVFKVNARTGEETRVRGVEIVGTPLTAINKIVAMGNDYQVFNGFCGAESGLIPQTEIAPSCVVSEIELQRSSTDNKRPPILPPPKLAGSARLNKRAAKRGPARGAKRP